MGLVDECMETSVKVVDFIIIIQLFIIFFLSHSNVTGLIKILIILC